MAQIHELIPRIMSEVGSIEKTRKNMQQNYTFRGIDDIYAALQEPLAKHGVFYTPRILKWERTERESKGGGTLLYTLLEVEYTFWAPDGSHIVSSIVGEGFDSGDKSSNKALSSALKYALLQIFCIPTIEPKDSEYENPEPKYKPARKPIIEGPEPLLEDIRVSSQEYERLRQTATANHWTQQSVKDFLLKQKNQGSNERDAFNAAVMKFTKSPTDNEELLHA